MELERIKRYKDKIEHIREGIGDIKSWANVYEDFISDKKTQLATYKAFQEVSEACDDIAAMLVRDVGGFQRTTTPI